MYVNDVFHRFLLVKKKLNNELISFRFRFLIMYETSSDVVNEVGVCLLTHCGVGHAHTLHDSHCATLFYTHSITSEAACASAVCRVSTASSKWHSKTQSRFTFNHKLVFLFLFLQLCRGKGHRVSHSFSVTLSVTTSCFAHSLQGHICFLKHNLMQNRCPLHTPTLFLLILPLMYCLNL